MSLMRGSYFVFLFEMLSSGNLSWQYVNSTTCIMMDGQGFVGCGVSCGWFSTSSMSGGVLHYIGIVVWGMCMGVAKELLYF